MKKKKILAAILSLAMVSSMIPFSAISISAIDHTIPATKTTDKYDIDGDGIKDIVYEISTEDQLYWFADKVNNDNENYGSANAVLTEDIVINRNVLNADDTLNEADKENFTVWTPIGNYNKKYSGIFDGQGHTVSGVYYNDANKEEHTEYIGLFGCLDIQGVIRNVGVIDSYIYGNYWYVGGVCGWSKGTITGCYNDSIVNSGEEGNNVGGVCGMNYQGTITGCYNAGIVNGGKSYVGGICGENYQGTVVGCYNTGIINGDDYVGGVCGWGYGGTIAGCYNIGTVSVSEGNSVGGLNGSALTSKITGCYTNKKYTSDKDSYVKTDTEFTDGTVCVLLNNALKTVSSEYEYISSLDGFPVLIKPERKNTAVTYNVAPTYTVTIPAEVTLGGTATISASDVVLVKGKQVEVALTGTSETDNTFKVKSAEDAEIIYTVKNGENTISVGDNVLTVNPTNGKTGATTLSFSEPTEKKFSGTYTGTVTFTVSVANA